MTMAYLLHLHIARYQILRMGMMHQIQVLWTSTILHTQSGNEESLDSFKRAHDSCAENEVDACLKASSSATLRDVFALKRWALVWTGSCKLTDP